LERRTSAEVSAGTAPAKLSPAPPRSETTDWGEHGAASGAAPADRAPAQAVLRSPGSAPLPTPRWRGSADTSGYSLCPLATEVTGRKINALTPKYLSTQQRSQTLSNFNDEQIKAVQQVPADKGCAAQVCLITFSP